MTLAPAYADDLVRVYHADHQTLAAHMRETGEVCDAMIVDAPYSERTHAGHDGADRNDGSGIVARHDPAYGHREKTRGLGYSAWTPTDVAEFVRAWAPLVAGWAVSLTDDVLAPEWRASFEAAQRYAFAPVPIVEIGSRVRLVGDGPSSWTCYAMVSRPSDGAWLSAWRDSRRARQEPCALRGAYVYNGHGDREWMGGKRVDSVRALVRDYSRPGDLIVDSCCGGGTLGVAVRYEGRRAILADKDPAAVECTIKRLRGERTKATRDDFPESAEQPSLFTRSA